VRGAGASEPCSRLIPLHWSPSLPVPALDGGKTVYKMFFFGRDGDPRAGFVFHHAEGDATLSGDGRTLSCSRRPGQAGSLPKPEHPSGATLDQIDALESSLYPALKDAAALYASGRPLGPEEKKRLAAFAGDFAFFVEPGQGADYLALSPDFWAWVEKNGGAAPRK
jgi:hypothetical protein